MEEKKNTGYPSIDKPWLKYYTKEAINGDLPEMTTYEYLYNRNKKNLNKVALNYYGRKIKYGELFDNIDIVSKSLINYGVNKGDIVTISMPTFPETIYLFYALSKIGAVANMIDPRTNAEGIKDYVEECDSKLLFFVDVIQDKINKIKDQLKCENIISISPSDSLPFPLSVAVNLKKKLNGDKSTELSTKWKKFYSIGVNDSKKYDAIKYEKNMPVVIVHTGGTTGKPKGVVLSNDNINACSYQCEIAGYDFQSKHSWLNIMPPFIAYGIGNGLHLPLSCGMETILIPQFNPEKFADLLNKYKPNHMVGVPSHYGNIINSKKMKNKDLSYIIAPTVGGDKMDETLEKETNDFLKKHNCEYKVVKGYGMTEVNAAVAACTSNETNEIGSVGIPFPKTIISIFNPGTDEELKFNEVGEICITGPNTMLGYFKNSDETNNILKIHRDGKTWVHSGDFGYMNDSGKLFILDRIKRIIIRHDGFKIFPNMIEDCILKHPDVESCKVVGVKDIHNIQGKLSKAHIILKKDVAKDESIILEELYQLCSKNLPEYMQPCDIEINDKFPLTSIGKVDFIELERKDNENINKTIKKYTKN